MRKPAIRYHCIRVKKEFIIMLAHLNGIENNKRERSKELNNYVKIAAEIALKMTVTPQKMTRNASNCV